MTEGELEGKCLPGRRRTAWIYDARRWTEGGLLSARRLALDRLSHYDDKKNQNNKYCSEMYTAVQRLSYTEREYNHKLM